MNDPKRSRLESHPGDPGYWGAYAAAMPDPEADPPEPYKFRTDARVESVE